MLLVEHCRDPDSHRENEDNSHLKPDVRRLAPGDRREDQPGQSREDGHKRPVRGPGAEVSRAPRAPSVGPREHRHHDDEGEAQRCHGVAAGPAHHRHYRRDVRIQHAGQALRAHQAPSDRRGTGQTEWQPTDAARSHARDARMVRAPTGPRSGLLFGCLRHVASLRACLG